MLMLCFGRAEGADKPVAYDLGNGYTAVENTTFDQLIENDKLVDLLKQERDYYKEVYEKAKVLNADKDKIQDERINVLHDTIGLQKQIIDFKDMNINNYKTLYEMKSDEVKKYKAKSLLDKALVLGLGAWAVSEVDDTSTKIGMGALTLTYVFK